MLIHPQDHGWKAPAKTVIIATTPRSGCTLLFSKMKTTGVLGNPGEYFHPESLGTKSIVDHACMRVLREGQTPNGVVSFKLAPWHFDRVQREIRLSEWFPDPVWVFLRRDDLLGQAVSLAIALQTKAWHFLSKPVGPPEYSRQAIEAAMRRLNQDNQRWSTYFARNAIEPLRLVYEDIVDDFDTVCGEIGRRLELGQDVPATRETDIMKQRNAINEEWRRRFVAEAGDPHYLDLAGGLKRPHKPVLEKWLDSLRRRVWRPAGASRA